MKEFDRSEFLNQLNTVLAEIKKLKEMKGVSGDMDLLDEVRVMNDFLMASDYDWNIIIDVLLDIFQCYMFRSGASLKDKENVYVVIAAFIKKVAELNRYRGYTRSLQIITEKILTETDHD